LRGVANVLSSGMDNEAPIQMRPTDLAEKLACSVAYASQLLSGARVPSIPRALEIYDKAGVKLGPLANATDEQIEAVRSMAA
jgi:transcriptional regulator with XRE-family HTH domain